MILDSKSTRGAKLQAIGFWGLQLLTAAVFLMAGIAKLSGSPGDVETFEKIGMGQWLRYFTGGIEVASAIMLVVPSLSALGAFLLIGTMTGAVMTHLFLIGGSPVPALVLGSFAAFILWARFGTVQAWFGRRAKPRVLTVRDCLAPRISLDVRGGACQYQTR